MTDLKNILKNNGVSILVDSNVKNILKEESLMPEGSMWEEEFLAMECFIGSVDSTKEAIQKINKYSGGHSATIMTTSNKTASLFMEQVDHATIQRWVFKLTTLVEQQFRNRKKSVGRRWRLDEIYIKVKGKWRYLYRAVDKNGNTLDFLLNKK